MQTTARRYTTPATPPALVSRPLAEVRIGASAPVLCIRCGDAERRAATDLVSFAWGRTAPPRSRR